MNVREVEKTLNSNISDFLKVAEEEVSTVLVSIGILPNVHGYYLLRDLALMMVFNDSRQNMSKAYKELSKRSGKSAASIERNIRSAISGAYRLGQLIKINSLLGLNIMEKNYCLTNSQLAAILAEFACKRLVHYTEDLT